MNLDLFLTDSMVLFFVFQKFNMKYGTLTVFLTLNKFSLVVG